jgi:hypothetical protein
MADLGCFFEKIDLGPLVVKTNKNALFTQNIELGNHALGGINMHLSSLD